jgi:predicted N-acetyltransferase YhbS
MMEYRNAKPGEREEYMDLARLSFGFDLERLIPKVYEVDQDPSAYHKVAVDERGRIRSQVAVLPQTLSVAGQPLTAGFLGIVSTHPRDRGRGHMKALMELCVDESRRSFDLVVLYGQRQRYEHYGFTSGGIRVRHTVESANARHAFAEVESGDISFIPFPDSRESHRSARVLNEKRLAFVVRNEADISKILLGFGQKAWAIVEGGRPLGYVTTNSEGNEITELALSDHADLKRVLKGYLEFSRKSSITVLMPEYETVLNRTLSRFAERTWAEPADMYFIADFPKVLLAYLELKRAAGGLAPGSFSAVLAGQPVTAIVDESGVSVVRQASPGAVELDRQESQTLLLSAYGKAENAVSPAGWFPLPVFWYYADRF